jgi:uncharacterized phage-associated protein
MIDVLELAKYLLYLSEKEVEQAGEEAASDMDPMKLQKLLYYCQGYSLGLTGRPLFNDAIEAWKYGPVIRKVYKEYQNYTRSYFPLHMMNTPPEIDDYTSSIASLVMKDKGKFSAIALMKMTHQETAWQEAWHKEEDSSVSNPFASEALSIETMQRDFERKLTDELEEEEEEKLWNSIGRKPTMEEWKEIAISI